MTRATENFTNLHEPSRCDRRPAVISKGNFSGHLLVGPWPGRLLYTGSWLELSWAYCLDADPTTHELSEQAAFAWRDVAGKARTHFFDLLVDQRDGKTIAYTVKPERKITARFEREIPLIAFQARMSGFVDDVRLLTDADLDPVELWNAKLTHGMRAPDKHSDRAAIEVVGRMSGVVTLDELTERIGLGASGFRALVRLLRTGHLRSVRHERIAHSTEVFKTGGR